MRTTVDLPTDLMRQLKARAGARGESLKTLFARAVQTELRRGGGGSEARSSRVTLPLFGDPAGPTVRLSGADVAAALAATDVLAAHDADTAAGVDSPRRRKRR